MLIQQYATYKPFLQTSPKQLRLKQAIIDYLQNDTQRL